MDPYQLQIFEELKTWQKEMLKRPSFLNWISVKVQVKVNSWIPEKVHKAITVVMKQMIKGVLFGAKHTTAKQDRIGSLFEIESTVHQRIKIYKNTAAVEGGVSGAGGILLGLADFPILLSIKIKLLFDIASLYGFDVNDYKERVYILHIFELAFSSHAHRKSVYLKMVDWEQKCKTLPEDINQFEWRNLQQQYRDYIDIAKMAQLVPVIGAPVGVLANYSLVKKLGTTAMNAYRMRILG
jgi:hypothetical protein